MWTNGTWRSDHSGATQLTEYETYTYPNGTIDACYLNTTLGFPCEQGRVSVIGVDARSPEDIQAAVMFASQHNLRLVIKNTGCRYSYIIPHICKALMYHSFSHDFLGRSSAKGSFLIWTHNMKNITFQATFTPDGADSSVVYDNGMHR
jgi:hypothetical protein